MANKSDKTENARIGKLLRAARKAKGVTQIDMGKAIGISTNHLSALECGHFKPSVSLLLGYCEKLQMTPNEILRYDDTQLLSELKELLQHADIKTQQKVIEILKLMSDR